MNSTPSCEASALSHGFYGNHAVPGPDGRGRAQPTSEQQPPSSRPRSPYTLYAKSFLGLSWSPGGAGGAAPRRRREFTPDEHKDTTYWVKRRRNNEAARRSRQRRRMDELLLEKRAVELLRENEKLKATLSAVHFRCAPVAAGLCSPQGFAAPAFQEARAGARWDCQPPARLPAAAAAPSWMLPGATFHDPFAGYAESTRSPGLSLLNAFCALPVSSAPSALSQARSSPSGPCAAGSASWARCDARPSERGSGRADEEAQKPQGAHRGIEGEPPHENRVIRPHGLGAQASSSLSSAEAVFVETAAPSLPYKLRFKGSGCKRYERFQLAASGAEAEPSSPGPKRCGGPQ